MKRSDFKQSAEQILGWEISERQTDILVDMAKITGSGKLVLDNYQLFLARGKQKSVDAFVIWWEENRPNEESTEIVEPVKNRTLGFGDGPWNKGK